MAVAKLTPDRTYPVVLTDRPPVDRTGQPRLAEVDHAAEVVRVWRKVPREQQRALIETCERYGARFLPGHPPRLHWLSGCFRVGTQAAAAAPPARRKRRCSLPGR
jgi:hypothetical protein